MKVLPCRLLLFLRGDAVAVLIVLKSENLSGVVMVEQFRFAAAILKSLEIPAGMMDDKDDFRSALLKEIKEETGLDISCFDLVELGNFNPAVGACDEAIKFYFYQQEMPEVDLLKIKNCLAGAYDENEKSSLKLPL